MKRERSGLQPSALPRVNFRPTLFSAFGIAFGVFLYLRIRLGGPEPSDFLLLSCFLPLCFFPFTKKRVLALVCLFTVFAAAGAVGIHIYTENYLSGKEEGVYAVEGTVTRINVRNGYTQAELDGLLFDGEGVTGKLSVNVLSEEVRTGDRLLFSAKIKRNELPSGVSDSYEFVNDIRYTAADVSAEEGDSGFHPFLFLNAKIYDTLTGEMGGEESLVAYALLTGNSTMIDSGFMTAVRSGGIAHIFAVSGLHIGILYGAALLLCRPLKRYAALPAIVVSTLYCALCGFTVSALRALIMCIVLSINGFLGRKSDMLGSVSLAGTAVLLFLPAQWLSVGFRLSFGACLGLALFSGMLTRGLKRAHIPRFFRDYLAASLSVQLFTFPIVMDAFGYFSVWGLGLNLIIVPLLPFAFLTLILCTVCSLVIPPAAAFFLIFPKGLFAVLLFLFAAVDFGYVLTGFAFGSCGIVWLCGTVYCTERVRMRFSARISAFCVAAALFSCCLVAENCLFGGIVVDTFESGDMTLALVRTGDVGVLVIDGDVNLKTCEDFLRRHTGHIDAAVVLSEAQQRALNVAAFTGAERVYCREERTDGFQNLDVIYGERFTEGELSFSFESDEVLLMFARGTAVKFDFEKTSLLQADFNVEKGCGSLKYFFDYGIILLL